MPIKQLTTGWLTNMASDKIEIINRYFEENNFVQSNIESFDGFVDWRLQKLVDEIKEAVPAVIPPEAEEVKFVFGNVRVEKPSIVEADGAKRNIAPTEARMRDLTYAATIYLEVSLLIDGKERERQEVKILDLPIMLKSKYCYLHGLSREELINIGEDPYDSGGYFIINGTERALVLLEDLASNQIFVDSEESGPITHIARVFSASTLYKIPHLVERGKDGIFLISFASNKKIPATVMFKSLGYTKDSDIPGLIGTDDEDVMINIINGSDIKTQEEAQEVIAKEMAMLIPREQKLQKVQYILDNLFLPHISMKPQDRARKAVFLGRMIKKLLLLKQGKIQPDDKDHYMNKRVRMAGDLLEDLFRANLKVLVGDMLYIFQRGVRRGKILTIPSIVRMKLPTQRIKSALATGNWTGNRQGVSQRLDRENALATLSHLQRASSLLEATRESFEARQLHPTHWGRLCPLESPEGKQIGLRKNLALLATITPELKEENISDNFQTLQHLGLRRIE